ncbi:response regulator transcription factor [Clostridium senegalense]|uniref:response regulator transcription factor n=1 Tax=Clostridium senegalense TaxID=1465809 RepID=UPI0002884F0A|nr:response regulator transcription factor [Clostridium senegalense]
MLKLIIADDDLLIRESLKIILSADKELDVLETFENGKEAVNYILTNNVDIALLDVRMPVLNGVEATKEITERTNTKVVILTTFDEDEYIDNALKFGAKGYILKNNAPNEIINTIKMVHKGNSVIQDNVLERLKCNFQNKSEIKLDKELFTQREIEIIKLISQGLSNKEISSNLYITEGTVKNYISSILNKTGLQHRTQIAIYYLKGNL